jgi:hypothetical protein
MPLPTRSVSLPVSERPFSAWSSRTTIRHSNFPSDARCTPSRFQVCKLSSEPRCQLCRQLSWFVRCFVWCQLYAHFLANHRAPAIAQFHVNSSPHTILCGYESGRLTPCFDKATVSAEIPANCYGMSAHQPSEFPRHIRGYVREIFAQLPVKNPGIVPVNTTQVTGNVRSMSGPNPAIAGRLSSNVRDAAGRRPSCVRATAGQCPGVDRASDRTTSANFPFPRFVPGRIRVLASVSPRPRPQSVHVHIQSVTATAVSPCPRTVHANNRVREQSRSGELIARKRDSETVHIKRTHFNSWAAGFVVFARFKGCGRKASISSAENVRSSLIWSARCADR